MPSSNQSPPWTFLKAVEEAFLLQEGDDFLMPDRMHVGKDGNVLLLMPAFSKDHFSTKLASVFPKNPKAGLPSIYASVMLNDGSTGMPLALLDGSVLTGLRTGAVGALGAAFTTPKGIGKLGLIGAGYQGFHQLMFVASVRDIRTVSVYDPFVSDQEAVLNKFRRLLPHVTFSFVQDAAEVVRNAELVVTATTSMEPVIPDDRNLIEGRHFVGIGSYKTEMREFPDALIQLCDSVIIDTDLAAEESGDLRIPIKNGLIKTDQLFRLGQLINGEQQIDTGKTTFFKSVGMALFDLISSKIIYEKATEKGLGIEIEF